MTPAENTQTPTTSTQLLNEDLPARKPVHKMKFGKSARLSVMLVMTFGYFLCEIVVGYRNSAMSLVADSFHMLSDVLSIFVGLAAVRLKRRQAKSDKYSFGYKRAEIAGALCNAVFLLALCFVIIVEAVQRFIQPEQMREAKLVFVVGTIGLAVNVVGLLMFWEEGGHAHSHGGGGGGHGHSHDNDAYDETHHDGGHGHSHGSEDGKGKDKSKYNMNIHGVWLHVLGDALGSVVVMIAAGLIWYVEDNILTTPYLNSNSKLKLQNGSSYTLAELFSNTSNTSSTQVTLHEMEGLIDNYDRFAQKDFWWFVYNYADPLLSVIITLIILCSTIPLAKTSLKIILQARPAGFDVDLKKIESELKESLDATINLHHLHAWELSSDTTIASVHMKLPESIDVYRAAMAKLREKLCDTYKVHHLTVQPEFEALNSSFTNGDPLSFKKCTEEACCGDGKENGPVCGLPN